VDLSAQIIQITAQGSPDVLQPASVTLAPPGKGEVLIRQTAIGLNYQDVYFRAGPYGMALPSGIGGEAAGVVEAVGEGVATCKPGDRVAYGGSAPGAYATRRIMPAARLVPIPDGVSDELAAAVLMKGMTVEYLLLRCFPVAAEQSVLFYAAAGGVGLIAGQWGNALGARMIGVAAGEAKCALARAHGYAEVIDRTRANIPEQVRALTGGRGVAVAYDSVGRATFEDTLASLAPRGYFVSFGATTGKAPPVDCELLQKGGSLYFTRPTLATYIAAREDLVASAAKVFDMVVRGVVTPSIGQRYALMDAATAHRDLEAGRTSGSSILMPS
jgi:NADPH2:quinone reductase